MTDDATDLPVAERRGRPAGLPKSGGRKPGVPNKVTADLKAIILKRGRPIELLCDVARGLKVRVGPQAGPGEPTFTYPTLQDRLAAARTLLGKVVPDMKAVELSGADGGPIAVADTAEAIEARAAAWTRLGEALRAGQEQPAGSDDGHERHHPAPNPPDAIQGADFPAYQRL